MSDDEKRVIKKYPNRRLYDTARSKYVTLHDVRKLVLEQISFCVIDKKSGEDITRNILLQIIIEQEDEGEPLFSTDVLEQIIGFYGDSVQEVPGDFLSQSLKLFHEHHERFRAQTGDAAQNGPISPALTELAKRNVGLSQVMQDHVFRSAKAPGNSETDDKE